MAEKKLTTIRLDPRFIEIVEGYEGKSFSDKLHNLVYFCVDEVPKAKKRLSSIQQDIEKETDRYYKAMARMRDFSNLRNIIEDLERLGNRAAQHIEKFVERELGEESGRQK